MTDKEKKPFLKFVRSDFTDRALLIGVGVDWGSLSILADAEPAIFDSMVFGPFTVQVNVEPHRGTCWLFWNDGHPTPNVLLATAKAPPSRKPVTARWISGAAEWKAPPAVAKLSDNFGQEIDKFEDEINMLRKIVGELPRRLDHLSYANFRIQQALERELDEKAAEAASNGHEPTDEDDETGRRDD